MNRTKLLKAILLSALFVVILGAVMYGGSQIILTSNFVLILWNLLKLIVSSLMVVVLFACIVYIIYESLGG